MVQCICYLHLTMIHISVLLFSFLLTSCSSLQFNFPRFDHNSEGILYEGDAVPSAGGVEFSNTSYLSRVGRVTYAKSVRIWDSSSGELADFTTNFSFFVDTLGKSSLNYGHGFSFFLAPVGFQIPLNSAGEFLGLFNTTTIDPSSKNQILTVEFDSFPNREWDPPYEHVGINNNSISSVQHVRWNASSNSGDIANAYITYNATTKNLSVYWTYERNPVFRGESLLSHEIDLAQILPEWVTMGFSAATGEYVERHNLQSWEFSSSLNSNAREKKNGNKTKLVVGLSVLAAVITCGVVTALIILLKRCRMQKIMPPPSQSLNADFERTGPKTYTYSALSAATNNFSDDRKLGEGGFGCVYKGFLSNPEFPVAVKKISRYSRQGKKEYIAEVKAISQLRHRNLVQLMGWCHETDEFMLVYEFMPNGSLDAHLFGERDYLAWPVRYKITLGLACVLLYLHEEWQKCVVHRDIKPSNVMLDSSFNAKLGDFGLAQLTDHELGSPTIGLAGTLGYMAPEYVKTGKASRETDVFSFGVLILEICSGRKSVNYVDEESGMCLVEWVWDLYGKGKVLSAVDEKLALEFDVSQAECLLIVGLWCAHPDSHSRPTVRQAVHVLNYQSKIPELRIHMQASSFHTPDGMFSSSGPPSITSSLELGR